MPEIPQPPHPVVALRAAVLAHGLQPIAVYTRGKRPFGAAWEQTRGAPPLVPAALSTGILCDRIRAVDIDIDEPEAARRAAAVVAATLGPSSFIRTRPDSPRLTVLYRGQGKKRIIKLDAGKDPQAYGIGLKELWEIDPSKHVPGLVVGGHHVLQFPYAFLEQVVQAIAARIVAIARAASALPEETP